MSEQSGERVGVTAVSPDPLGAVVIGAIVVVIGAFVVATPAALIGALAVISGMMLVCTGMIQRAIERH